MKKTLYFILAIVLVAQAAFASQIIIGRKKGYYNDFSADTNCVAVYNFESGALTTDSKGSNTLTDINGVGTDTTNFIQGAASAYFQKANTEAFTVEEANLSADFPLKDADSTKNFSVVVWFRIASMPASGDNYDLVTKSSWNTAALRSFAVGLGNTAGDTELYFLACNSDGSILELVPNTYNLSVDTWYCGIITYQNSDMGYSVRLRDAAGGVLGTDLTGVFTLDANKINAAAGNFTIGAVHSTGSTYLVPFDGEIDQVVIFKDVLTEAEATNIAKGVYR